MRIFPALAVFLSPPTLAEPRTLMVLGDSQSEEYRFEVPFSAPASRPFESNTQNWVEILANHRSDEISFGDYKSNLFEWGDVRNAGYQYNWSIPGAFLSTWLEVLNSSIFQDQEYLDSKIKLLDQLDEVDGVVIFLGGNDIRSNYSELHRNEPPTDWPQPLINQMEELIDIIQSGNPDLPIIVGDFPDVGGTEKTRLDHPEQAGREIASAHVAEANRQLRTLLDEKGLPLFEVSRVTSLLLDDSPIRIGNIEFLPSGSPENPPRYLLCRDGFHPSTSSQAVITNLIVDSLNAAHSWELTPLSDQEIVSDILGMDPTVDDLYLDWIESFDLSNSSLIADPDGDGLNNLGEYALDLNPAQPDAPGLTRDLSFDFTPHPDRIGYVSTRATGSSDLINWTPVNLNPPFTPTQPFLRLEFFLPDDSP